MKSKSLIGIAVASTFACASAAHAGPNHHASWVASGDEIYPAMVMFEGQGSQTLAMDSTVSGSTESRASNASIGSTSAAAGGRVGGYFPSRHVTTRHSSYDIPWVASGDEIYPPMVFSEGSRPSELAGDSSNFSGPRNELSALEGGPVDRGSEGIYSEYYLVTWSPMTAPAWETYLIPFEPDNGDVLVLLDDADYIIAAYDVILLPSDFVESNANSRTSSEEPAA